MGGCVGVRVFVPPLDSCRPCVEVRFKATFVKSRVFCWVVGSWISRCVEGRSPVVFSGEVEVVWFGEEFGAILSYPQHIFI